MKKIIYKKGKTSLEEKKDKKNGVKKKIKINSIFNDLAISHLHLFWIYFFQY